MEITLLAAAAIGIGAMWATLWWEGPRGNAVECDRDVFEMAFTAAIVGLVVGRLASMVGNGVNPLTNPADIPSRKARYSRRLTGTPAVAPARTVRRISQSTAGSHGSLR